MVKGRKCEGCGNREFRLEPDKRGGGFKVRCTECGRRQGLKAVPLRGEDLRKLEELWRGKEREKRKNLG